MKTKALFPTSIFLLMSLAFSLSAFANEGESSLASPYSFGGSCASQGAWTQQALTSTQNLRRITLKLKNDPNCSSLGKNMQNALASLESNLKSASDSDVRTTRLSQIPSELGALRTFAQSSKDSKQSILKLMMDRSIEGATLSAEVGSVSNTRVSNQMLDFGSRVSRSSKVGISLLNQVVDELPQLNECLMGDGAQAMGSFLSATVKIAASFSSSSADQTGNQLATTVSKLTTYIRSKKFSKVLRTLNQQEFMTSMSCLMELTSESYCQAREGMGLFQSGMKSLKNKKINGKISPTNPYVGYYILNTHVPNITKWMQKIQVGVDPKLPTDADFQNKINQEVTDFFKSVKTLLGDYNSKVITVKTLPTLEQKQNAVLSLLLTVSERMTAGDSSFGRGGDKVNFFGMAKTTLKIPFYLIGMDEVPDQVSGRAMPQLTYNQWFAANLQVIPAFKDPVALAETIRVNMNSLIREANIATIEYFNRWYIVDKGALVNESVTDVNYTVKDSLKAIRDYLELAKNRIAKYEGDATAIPLIIETQVRINIILKAYEDLENLGKTWKNQKAKNVTLQEINANAELYEKLINTVYDQFNVMHSKSGYLANRMVTFVYKDYDLLIKNKVDFTPFQEELFQSQGMAAFDRMLQLYNGNPANIKSDLDMALRVNSGNLSAIELLLKDNFVATIAEVKMIADDSSMLSDSIFFNSMKRMMIDIKRDAMNIKNRTALQLILSPMGDHPVSYWFKHSDRYPLKSTTGKATRPQSEFEDAASLQAQLCVQALAFYDQVAISDICNGTVLKSPIDEIPNLNFSYDKVLKKHLDNKALSAQMRKSMNHSDRVCAFRDYNRKTMVYYMQVTKDR